MKVIQLFKEVPGISAGGRRKTGLAFFVAVFPGLVGTYAFTSQGANP